MDAIAVEKLVKRYPAFSLKGISFCVHEGSITGFVGRNGAGKTTTIKCLFNEVHPESGGVFFFGKEFISNELEIKRQIGYVPGGFDFYPRKKLKTILQVTRRFYPNWDESACQRYMKQFQLDPAKTPAQLSAGMKVKFALVLAMSHHAKLLILDEPTSGLDPVSREDLLELFLNLVEEEGVTIFFSTHITSDLEKCAEDIVYIRNGEIFACDNLDAFQERYRIAQLTGEQLTEDVKQGLIGWRRNREGYSVLFDKGQEAPAGVSGGEKADLDTIMSHIEMGTGGGN